MDNIDQLSLFITEIKENDRLWLLEAKPGLFAMLEDAEENSYIPVWSREEYAKDGKSDEWAEYSVTFMIIKEFMSWMHELSEDNIGIAISYGKESQVLPIPAEIMKKILSDDETNAKSDRELVGEEFYDEEWAEGFPEGWEDDENDEED